MEEFITMIRLKCIWGVFIYQLGRWFANGSLTLREIGYFSLGKRFYNLSIVIHEQALLFFEKTPMSVREYRNSIQIRKFLKYVFKNTPFYRELLVKNKINLKEIRSSRDLYKIPILKREEVKAAPKKLVAESHPENHCIPDETSGSTGVPLHFCLDRCSMPEFKARLFHLWRLAGVEPHETTLLLSSPKFKKLTPESVIHTNPPRIHNDFEQTIAKIRDFKPKFLRGNPLATLEFCWLIRKNEIRDVAFETAILYGNILTPKMRVFIEEILKCKAISLYALGEIGGVAEECSFQKGHHIITDSVIVEVVDKNGNRVPDGTMGEIIVTDLTNFMMPFIRYDTGDLGKFLEEPCPCGKSSPLLFVDGREEEMLMRQDGTLVFGGSTRDTLDKYNNIIERYQIFQEKIGEFIVRIVPADNFNKTMGNRMLDDLKVLFGSSAKISIEYIASIPLEPSGKFKQFISLPWKKRFPSGTFSGSAQ